MIESNLQNQILILKAVMETNREMGLENNQSGNISIVKLNILLKSVLSLNTKAEQLQ